MSHLYVKYKISVSQRNPDLNNNIFTIPTLGLHNQLVLIKR